MNATEKAADNIKKMNEILWTARHEYRRVDAKAFRHLDLNFYNRTRDALIGQGCAWLVDVEDVTLIGTSSDFRTFIRFFVSKDHTICIALYHPKPKIWMRFLLWIFGAKIGRTIDCESELSSGEYIVTSSAAVAGKLDSPPGFDMVYFPVGTDHDTLIRAHSKRLYDFLSASPSIHATPMRSSEDVLEMQHRMQTAKSAYRKGIGYVTVEELKRLGAKPNMAADIKDAMDRS